MSYIVIKLDDVPAMRVESFDDREIVCATGKFDVWRCDGNQRLELVDTGLSDAQVIGKVMAGAPFPLRGTTVLGSVIRTDDDNRQDLLNAETLAMFLSSQIFRATGFGPSRKICRPFAEQVVAEAKSVGFDLGILKPRWPE